MRYLYFFLMVALLSACNNEGSTSSTATPASNTSSRQPVASSVRNFPPAGPADIQITINGAQPGLAYLIGIYTDQQFKMDSAMVDNAGRLNFKNPDGYARGFAYVLLPNRANFQLLLDGDQEFTMQANANDLTGSMVVKGCIDNELLYDSRRFEAKQRPVYDQITSRLQSLKKGTVEYDDAKGEQNALLDERKAYLEGIFKKNPNTLFTSFKRAGQNPEVEEQLNPDGTPNTKKRVWMYRTKFWDGVDFTDERLIRTPVITNKLKRYINELTPQHPDSILSAAYFLVDQVPPQSDFFKYFVNWIVINYDPLETTLMDPQAVFANMVQKYFTYDKAFWSDSVEVFSLQQRAHEMAASLVGRKGPNVTAPGINGKSQSIYDIDAPYIIVYMYNPDCEHCAEQTPKLVDFYKEWKSKGVEVYGIAIDTDDAKWRDYVAKNKMGDWINVHDPTNKSIYATYFVDHTPELYVLNPDRTIIAKNLKVNQVAQMIENDQEKRK